MSVCYILIRCLPFCHFQYHLMDLTCVSWSAYLYSTLKDDLMPKSTGSQEEWSVFPKFVLDLKAERRKNKSSQKLGHLWNWGERFDETRRRSIRSLSELQNNPDNLDRRPAKLSHPNLTKTMLVRITWHIIRASGAQLFLTIVAKCPEVSSLYSESQPK